ncbi:hypothetical protein LTR74_003355 [Friedmanniomyces endolithicus]|nr:hypothetical protein LTR74_003355 [Friedmanniomyces endolithicus]
MPPSINEHELQRFIAEFPLRYDRANARVKVGHCRVHELHDMANDVASYDRPADVWAATGDGAPFVLNCDCFEGRHAYHHIAVDFPNLAHDGHRARPTTKQVLHMAVTEVLRRHDQNDQHAGVANGDQQARAADGDRQAGAADGDRQARAADGNQQAGAADGDGGDGLAGAAREHATCAICLDDYADTPHAAIGMAPNLTELQTRVYGYLPTVFHAMEHCYTATIASLSGPLEAVADFGPYVVAAFRETIEHLHLTLLNLLGHDTLELAAITALFGGAVLVGLILVKGAGLATRGLVLLAAGVVGLVGRLWHRAGQPMLKLAFAVVVVTAIRYRYPTRLWPQFQEPKVALHNSLNLQDRHVGAAFGALRHILANTTDPIALQGAAEELYNWASFTQTIRYYGPNDAAVAAWTWTTWANMTRDTQAHNMDLVGLFQWNLWAPLEFEY